MSETTKAQVNSAFGVEQNKPAGNFIFTFGNILRVLPLLNFMY